MKLVSNATTLVTTAILGMPMLEAVALPGMRDLMLRSGQEALDTGTALDHRILPIFGQELFEQAEARGSLDDDDYRQALADGPESMREIVAALLVDHELDAIVTVANSFAWKTDWVAGDRFMVGSSAMAAMSGFPSVTVPAGDVAGLPVGVAFVGGPFAEAKLIRIAHAFEQASGAAIEPGFRPTLETPGMDDADLSPAR